MTARSVLQLRFPCACKHCHTACHYDPAEIFQLSPCTHGLPVCTQFLPARCTSQQLMPDALTSLAGRTLKCVGTMSCCLIVWGIREEDCSQEKEVMSRHGDPLFFWLWK
jgi:hypothetical protein